MIKSWAIAAGVFIFACATFFLYGKRKESENDAAKAVKTVNDSLAEISKTSKEVKNNVEKNSAANPDASIDELRKHWDAGN